MVCDTLVYHPAVTKLIKLLDTTIGREKILRLLQYLCRFIAFQNKSATAHGLQLQFLLIRKVLRFLKPLGHIQAASKLYDQTLTGDYVIRKFNILKNLAMALYLGFDQLNLLRLLRLLPLNHFTTASVPKLANWFWLIGLINGIVVDLRNIQLSYLKLKEIKLEEKTVEKKHDSKEVGVNDGYDVGSHNKIIKQILIQKRSARRKLIWDVLDSFIVLNNLKYLASRDDFTGLAGVLTSIFALQDLWKDTKV